MKANNEAESKTEEEAAGRSWKIGLADRKVHESPARKSSQ